VALVAASVVLAVLAAALVTGLLPDPIQRAIYDGPVLIVGTAWLLWRIAHGRPIDPDA
jgi:hypothetical protein